MAESKRLSDLPAQKKALVVRADAYRVQMGAVAEELQERWTDHQSQWWLLAGTALRNLVFSQFSSKWERGLAALFSTWKMFNR